MKVDQYKPDLKVIFERKDLTNKTENFQYDVEFSKEFLLSNIIPKRIKEVSVSYSNNFCLHFVGFFTPLQKSHFKYYQKSGVYHIQNYGFRFENLQELAKVIKHKGEAGLVTFKNDFWNETDEDIYFLIFCPFSNIGSSSPFSANINYKFELTLERKDS